MTTPNISVTIINQHHLKLFNSFLRLFNSTQELVDWYISLSDYDRLVVESIKELLLLELVELKDTDLSFVQKYIKTFML